MGNNPRRGIRNEKEKMDPDNTKREGLDGGV
mgnify:CR=1 FL=1